MASIKFKNGKELLVLTDQEVLSPNILTLNNFIFAYYDPRDSKVYGPTEIWIDLDGGKWRITGNRAYIDAIYPNGINITDTAILRMNIDTAGKGYAGSWTSGREKIFETFSIGSNYCTGWFIDGYNAAGTINDFYNEAKQAKPKAAIVYNIQSGDEPPYSVQAVLLIGNSLVIANEWLGANVDFRKKFPISFDDSPYNPNPYEPGGPSGPGDLPPGTFDDESDPIPDSSLPTISSANTGFTRIYNPTLSQVQDLASYLWTTPDVIETIWNHIKQFFENPMEAMIGFNLVPVPVPDGGTTNFKLMYIDTGVQMTAAASQFVDRDCGTLKIERYYGSALDQSPYTKISCFLPYIGTVQLNTDEVMGTTLQVKYRVDICSGSCVAKIFVDGSCLYQYSGHCAIPIPFSAADFSSYVSAAVSVAKLAIGAATAGAAGVAAGAIPTAAQQTNQVITQATVSAPGTNLPALIPTRSPITEVSSDQSSTEASFSGISPTSISNTVGEIMTSKPHVEHSGSFSGNTGYLGIRRPYVIIERPNMCMPAQYQHFNGFPAMISMELGTCKGYTRIQQVQLTGMTATNPEQAEILELLKSGVVF